MKSMEASATTSARFMPLDSVQAIFSRIRDLYSLHKQFYEQLSSNVQQTQSSLQGLSTPKTVQATQRPVRAGNKQESAIVELRVAGIFLPLISQLNVAREYANNYSRAVHTVKRYVVENAQFAELARAIRLKRSKEVCTLESLLFKPVLRMQNLMSNLRDVLAVTRPSHPDYPELEAMLKIAQQTVPTSISQAAALVSQPASSSNAFVGMLFLLRYGVPFPFFLCLFAFLKIEPLSTSFGFHSLPEIAFVLFTNLLFCY